jgi:hypothetical protein
VPYSRSKSIGGSLQLPWVVATTIDDRIKPAPKQSRDIAIAVAMKRLNTACKGHGMGTTVQNRHLVATRQCSLNHMSTQKDRSTEYQKMHHYSLPVGCTSVANGKSVVRLHPFERTKVHRQRNLRPKSHI